MPTTSRILVAKALHMVFGQGSRVPDTWDADLPREDAAFAQALLGHCLRKWGRIQAYIRSQLAQPERGLPLGSQVGLAIGLAQLAWLPGVSDHACVNEAVELMGDRATGFPPHRGLANAILRTGARDRSDLARNLDSLPASLDRTPFTDRVLLEALVPWHQEDRTEELWGMLQEPPRPFFVAVKPGPLPEGLAPDPDLPGCLVLTPGAPFPRQWLASGAGMVQDRSSQALMAFHWDRPVHLIADLCAAPGGKTTALALRWPEAEIFAVEQHPRRARRLAENLQIRGVHAEVIVQDATEWLQKVDLQFDLILLDAPCSGSGTLRKHPELAWLGDSLQLPQLLNNQRTLLEAAVPKLGRQGLLVYSVCSWLPDEGVQHQQALLSKHSSLRSPMIWNRKLATRGEVFSPPPISWEGEGFQGFAITSVI